MSKSTEVIVVPTCPACKVDARLTSGGEIYPHRRDLAEKPMWKCDGCGGYVGCHPGSKRALGTPANAELRRARMLLHEQRVDPLWVTAPRCGLYSPEDERAVAKIQRSARVRVYSFLAERLGISRDDCHIAMFDLDTCRKAWAALHGVTYIEIRAWSQRQKAAA